MKTLPRIALTVCGVAVAALGVTSCSSSTTPNAATLLSQSQQKALGQFSVSYRLIASAKPTKAVPHPDIETVISQLSATAAVESIRFASGNGDLDTKLVNGFVYFRGGAQILETALGLTVSAAQHYAGQWISIPDTDSNFAAITGTLTLASQVSPLYPTGNVTIGAKTTINGHETWPISGAATSDPSRKAGAARIFIDTKTQLPVTSEVVALSPSNHKFTELARFVAWGGHVQVTAPTNAVPIDVVNKYHG